MKKKKFTEFLESDTPFLTLLRESKFARKILIVDLPFDKLFTRQMLTDELIHSYSVETFSNTVLSSEPLDRMLHFMHVLGKDKSFLAYGFTRIE